MQNIDGTLIPCSSCDSVSPARSRKKMLWTTFVVLVAVIGASFQGCNGKTAEEWKGRIIYQVPAVV